MVATAKEHQSYGEITESTVSFYVQFVAHFPHSLLAVTMFFDSGNYHLFHFIVSNVTVFLVVELAFKVFLFPDKISGHWVVNLFIHISYYATLSFLYDLLRVVKLILFSSFIVLEIFRLVKELFSSIFFQNIVKVNI